MYDKNARLEKIGDILKTEHAVSIRDLSTRFAVSEMTIRRDLNELSERGLVKLMHGGAVYNPEPPFNETERGYFLTEESRLYREEKSRIGQRAASLIDKDDTIIIDAGSTTEWLAKHLPEALPVTVLCYSLNILIEVRYKNPGTLVFGGGNFHENTLVFSSPEGLELIRRFRANKAFISAGGVNAKLGVTCLNPYEIEIKRAVLESSLQRVLLVDSSKFDMVKSCYFAELTDFHTIITDSNISETYRENIADAGIELIIV